MIDTDAADEGVSAAWVEDSLELSWVAAVSTAVEDSMPAGLLSQWQSLLLFPLLSRSLLVAVSILFQKKSLSWSRSVSDLVF